eukprot:TRINITY_DN46993_c0_g1_i1.p1 TRINITY_DN46993_c0_g1~~TRINITY_DN46993_c0_g1_i1.p1  ORF type:complete len:307 (-),score=89.01 TRINITY_DN46993_c0_g1_i1:137-1057(-)
MGDQETEIIAGVGNEVFYFFVLLVLLLVVAVAWYSTYVVEPVVQSVILVERSPVGSSVGSNQIQASSPEEVRQAVTQFLQQQPRDRGEELEEHPQPDQPPQQQPVPEQPQPVSEPEVVEVGPLPEEERVTVRLKFLNDTQKDVEASLVENIGQFKRRNFSEEISSNKNIRLIFNGQVLRDESSTLRSCGMFDKCVVHCLIHTASTSQAQGAAGGAHGHSHAQAQHAHGHTHNHAQLRDLDVSAYFIPILGLALAMLWYFAVAYNMYFNLMSTTALIGLTSLYFLSVYGTHFHVNVAVRTGPGVPQE